MKNWNYLIICILCSVSLAGLHAQNTKNLIWKTGLRYFEEAGFGQASFLSDNKTRDFEMSQELRTAKTGLPESHLSVKAHPKFITPLRAVQSLADSGFYTISAYTDHDSLYPDHLKDYNCGQHTYDLENGYNHGGTDFFLWPFPWHKMYNNEVEVVAAAPGILLYKQDGNFDQQCDLNSDNWNGAAVLHADGSSSWYIHLKKNSLTEKSVGEPVDAGEYLGVVGSSGKSFSPHLHFEVYNSGDSLIDPFFGNCNPDVMESWWINQEPYLDPGINKICTNHTLPVFGDCPTEEVINESNAFYPGDTIFLMSYFKNIFSGDQAEISVIRPDGSIHSNWIWTSPWEYQNATWLYFFTILDENEIKGTWTYSMVYKGKEYRYSFHLLDPSGINNSTIFPFRLFPNPACTQLSIVSKEYHELSPEIHIYDMLGVEQQILSQSGNSGITQINLGDLQQGLYFIEIISEGKRYLSKFIKQ